MCVVAEQCISAYLQCSAKEKKIKKKKYTHNLPAFAFKVSDNIISKMTLRVFIGYA